MASKVTAVPTSTGAAGLTVNKVVLGLAGGGGSGSVPCNVMVATLPVLPANRPVTIPSANPQEPAGDVAWKSGMVKCVARRLTVCVLVLYGLVDWKIRWSGLSSSDTPNRNEL